MKLLFFRFCERWTYSVLFSQTSSRKPNQGSEFSTWKSPGQGTGQSSDSGWSLMAWRWKLFYQSLSPSFYAPIYILSPTSQDALNVAYIEVCEGLKEQAEFLHHPDGWRGAISASFTTQSVWRDAEELEALDPPLQPCGCGWERALSAVSCSPLPLFSNQILLVTWLADVNASVACSSSDRAVISNK